MKSHLTYDHAQLGRGKTTFRGVPGPLPRTDGSGSELRRATRSLPGLPVVDGSRDTNDFMADDGGSQQCR